MESGKGGFTLLEVLLVLIIAGVVTLMFSGGITYALIWSQEANPRTEALFLAQEIMERTLRQEVEDLQCIPPTPRDGLVYEVDITMVHRLIWAREITVRIYQALEDTQEQILEIHSIHPAFVGGADNG